MRLHRLQIRAFGPFADEVTIDFDALSGDGLFLLHGQTGAGKSTVLDAVAFALYGQVPGARGIKRLHSDHARPEDVPQVRLEATIGGRRLRITRSPEYHRPKKRGSGTIKENAAGTLVWLDGSGPGLTRLPEIGEVVTRLLGMSAEQFFQVVLLPQGDFARFLRANPDDREDLLERLFDTQRFGDIEDWLRERTRMSSSALDNHTRTLERIAGQIVAVGGVDGPDEGELPADPDLDWAQMCVEAARTEHVRAQQVLTAARAAVDTAQAAHDDGMRRAQARGRGVAARERLERLAEGESALAVARDALAAARRAAPIAPIAQDLHVAVDEVAEADADLVRARTALASRAEGSALCEQDSAALGAAIERWTAESGRWEPLADRAAQRPQMVATIEALEGEIADTHRRIDELTTLLAQAPERRVAAAAALAAAAHARAQLPGLRSERDRLAALATSHTARESLATEIDRSSRALLDAREAYVAAGEHLVDLRGRRLAGMAAELATKLVDGQPCVVCGSAEHPAPAEGDPDTGVSDADEAAADAAEKQAGALRADAQAAHAALIERRDRLDEAIGVATRAQTDENLARINAELVAAEHAAERIPALEKSLAAVELEIDRWQEESEQTQSAQAARRERLSGLRAGLAELDAEVAEATGGRMSVAQRRSELAELCRCATRLRDAIAAAQRAHRRRDEVGARLVDACADAGFEDVDSARAAVASQTQIAEWESMLQRAASMRAAALETLDDEEVSAALVAEPVDTGALSAALTAAKHAAESAARTHEIAARRLGDIEQYAAQFWAAFDAAGPMRARHAELSGLAELVSGRGQNSRRMSLRSYVLAARLEEVLIAASARLHQMSSGRYEFTHSDAAGPRGRRGGLGIEVRDEYTGAERATTTLSGGETFFASLALALGLADVVSAESGGRVLDTIFIDEGFGSLDPEALDLVMGVLDDLRSGGRVVGVVSHVDELRARIPTQLHVIRGEDGSRVRMQSSLGVG